MICVNANMPKRAPVRCETCSLLLECLEHIFAYILITLVFFSLSDGFYRNGKTPKTHQLL